MSALASEPHLCYVNDFFFFPLSLSFRNGGDYFYFFCFLLKQLASRGCFSVLASGLERMPAYERGSRVGRVYAHACAVACHVGRG